MILCDGCEKWQHAVCFRIIDDADIPQSHLCNICAKTKVNVLSHLLPYIVHFQSDLLQAGSKTDPTLADLTEEQAKVFSAVLLNFHYWSFQSTCLLRRAILLCIESDFLSTDTIAKRLSVEVNVARGLLNNLVDEGALKDVRGRGYFAFICCN